MLKLMVTRNYRDATMIPLLNIQLALREVTASRERPVFVPTRCLEGVIGVRWDDFIIASVTELCQICARAGRYHFINIPTEVREGFGVV